MKVSNLNENSWFFTIFHYFGYSHHPPWYFANKKRYILGWLCVNNFNSFGTSKHNIISPPEFYISWCTYNHITFFPELDFQVSVITIFGWFFCAIVLCFVSCKFELKCFMSGIWNLWYPMQSFIFLDSLPMAKCTVHSYA